MALCQCRDFAATIWLSAWFASGLRRTRASECNSFRRLGSRPCHRKVGDVSLSPTPLTDFCNTQPTREHTTRSCRTGTRRGALARAGKRSRPERRSKESARAESPPPRSSEHPGHRRERRRDGNPPPAVLRSRSVLRGYPAKGATGATDRDVFRVSEPSRSRTMARPSTPGSTPPSHGAPPRGRA